MDHNCHVEPIQKFVTPEEQETAEILTLWIAGMGCPSCATRVRNGLLALKGVVRAEVNHQGATAVLLYNPVLVNITDIADAVAESGSASNHHYQLMSVVARAPA